MCALLTPRSRNARDNHPRDELFCVLVSRFWKHQGGIASQRVLWIRSESVNSAGENDAGDQQFRIRNLGAQIVCGIMELCEEGPDAREDVSGGSESSENFGLLPDGSRYVVYRVMLYCDDFRPFSSVLPQGSAGGCYMLPIGLPTRCRCSRSAVRIISFTPPGVSTNEVLLHIIPDLVHSGAERVDGIDAFGDPVKIFTDVVGFVGDYPAAAHTTDVMGHNAAAPSTLYNSEGVQEVDQACTAFIQE
ncbi:hypothetical protein BWQ96_07380 [Gracilariopsis chorda]|uniref:Uncharacterized protein n=1 Tax=Gracilariopsis chorda TaxID=448386 RepID=A0A2V3ILA3_9FLOR|nr:hypothetical protein BWQ96_07380 [Gracilariopsis chorda]|eukprot:PXF42872.1 hypothetical protein BWQ96_07380 [Gracilariopsis chorda]